MSTWADDYAARSDRDMAVYEARQHAERITELLAENARLRGALKRIASLKPRPALDPYNCEERLKRIARKALSGSGGGR